MCALQWKRAGVCIGIALAFGAAQLAAQPGGDQAIGFKVLVPDGAKVEIDGNKTRESGAARQFWSPPVQTGSTYSYNVKATYQGTTITRQLSLRHGAANTLDLRAAFQRAAEDKSQASPKTASEKPLPEKPLPEKKPVVTGKSTITEAEARALGIEAFIYGYPLVTMEYTRRVMTNTDVPKNNHAPMGQFFLSRTYPDAAFRDVTAPNADTLYSTAWLDLSKEPYVFSLPEQKNRYFLMPMLSGWTDVFEVPGQRTTGDGAQKYLITGPGWKGKAPADVKELRSPTNMVWILGRTYCTGTPEDYATVHKLQDQYQLVPLSAYGKPYTAPKGKVDPKIDMKTPVREQVNKLSAGQYFKLLAKLIKDNPPAAADAPMVAKLDKLGIVSGQPFDLAKADPAVAKGLQDVPAEGFKRIMAHFKEAGRLENGWTFSTKTGLYGTDYVQRAFITAIGLGANRPQDAVYPTSEVDAAGKPYDGANKYVVRFAKGQTPPAKAFWSLTMYDGDYFFVKNPLNRYNVSSRSEFVKNQDGSVDVYIQRDSPGKDKEANWLPAPAGKFVLMLRMYWPSEAPPSIIDGSWKLPPVRQAK